MRKKFLTKLYLYSQNLYTTLFKRSPAWNLKREDLLKYPANSLGHHLGAFLEKHGFELIPKVEQHDIYHLLTGYGTSVEEEIALQYLCLGNGKSSLYLFGSIVIGTLILPEYFKLYREAYQKGQGLASFHHFKYRTMLEVDFTSFQQMIVLNASEEVSAQALARA